MPACILIVDDNPENLELTGYLLRASGYATLTATDGIEGLALARGERPDLIICDIQMPRMDGFEVARKLKRDESLRHIPLLAVTAAAMVGDRDEILAGGFNGYLAKPIVPENFVQQVVAFLPPGLRSTSPRQPGTATVVSNTPRPTGPTILVVDNLQPNIDLACSMLGRYGYRTLTAKRMQEALALARQTPPDLILSDVCMEDGSGYDFITEVKADPRLKSIPFVFLTSTLSSERGREKGPALSAARLLFRPIEPQDLLAEIKACLRAKSER